VIASLLVVAVITDQFGVTRVCQCDGLWTQSDCESAL